MKQTIERHVLLARIVSTHGLHGELRILPLTQFREGLKAGSVVDISGCTWVVENLRGSNARPLLKLVGIDSIEEAESLKSQEIRGMISNDAALEKDEYRRLEMLGSTVVTEEGEVVGKIDDIMAYPAHEILKCGNLLIPFTKEFVKRVDVESGTVIARLIPGMIDEG